jgi:HK97 gp10 family phage protein
MEFDASALRTLASSLTEGPRELGQLTRTVVRKTAKDVERTAKGLAPVDTGNLKSSIGTSDLRAMGTSGAIEAEVRATANYSAFVELGTSRMAAQPFMGPALDQHTGPFEEAMAQIAERAVLGG